MSDDRRAMFSLHPGWLALASAIFLALIGTEAIATVRPEQAIFQTRIWLPFALFAMVVCVFPPPRMLGHMSYLLAILTLVLLVFLIAPGVPRSIVPIRNGARRWIELGMGISLQPTEFAKISFVLAMAWYLRYRESYRQITGLFVPFLLMFIPMGLILQQPDLGTAMLFIPGLFAMLIAAGAKLRHLGLLVAVGGMIGGVNIAVIAIDPPHAHGIGRAGTLPSWMHVMKPHQEKRFAALMWPERYDQREAFQGITAKRLVGAGGWFGVGKEHAKMLIRYNRLPEAHNDMIFAVLICRWGLMGGFVVFLLYLVLCGSMTWVAARSKDPFCRLACVGFAAILFAQATINMAMTIGLMPITGITLPFVSFGGSSIVTCFMMLGLTLNFATRKPAWLARPSFEYDRADTT